MIMKMIHIIIDEEIIFYNCLEVKDFYLFIFLSQYCLSTNLLTVFEKYHYKG